MMLNHYKILGVQMDASLDEIKAAHRKQVKTCHPDKVPGKVEEFKQIQEAYETLADPYRRAEHDDELAGIKPQRNNFRDYYHYVLIHNPARANHYQFLNEFLQLDDEESFVPEQPIPDRRFLVSRLNEIKRRINWEIDRLNARYTSPDRDTRERLRLLRDNEKKISLCSAVILAETGEKEVYDLILRPLYSDEVCGFIEQLGGIQALQWHMRACETLPGARGAQALWRANCLTPQNFARLTQGNRYKILQTSIAFATLCEANLLNQENIDLIFENRKHIDEFQMAFDNLQRGNLLNQHTLNIIIRTGKNAVYLAHSLSMMSSRGILNDETNVDRIHKMQEDGLGFWVAYLECTGELNPDDYHYLEWDAPPELADVNRHINRMFAHGLFILTGDHDKGRNMMQLALELKADLKQFFEQEPHIQESTKAQFKTSFIAKMHSRDHEMGRHRELWKVIIGNILIAFTGLGLFAIGMHYAMKGGAFFRQTQSEKLVDNLQGLINPVFNV
ncbi:J domain-containing protein [Legionella sp. CNM-4043-24]|uniref:J domain-containing protein n=1 Tax=Legionella sp. CNM-4043-24 TaxID=3421646 RepID=UPI00403B3702